MNTCPGIAETRAAVAESSVLVQSAMSPAPTKTGSPARAGVAFASVEGLDGLFGAVDCDERVEVLLSVGQARVGVARAVIRSVPLTGVPAVETGELVER